MTTDLPAPSDDERALSEALTERLGAKIAQSGGFLAFDQYMECVLYEPALGYYVAGQRRFGRAGDFVTAPELSALFGQCLATQIVQWFGQCPAVIWEFGAGSGELARQLVSTLAAAGIQDLRYRIIELSPDLRERQRAHLERSLPARLHSRIEWLDSLPDRIDGVVLANELLDAMPVKLFEITDQGVAECGAGQSRRVLGWRRRPAAPAFERAVLARLAASGWPREAFAPGYRSELGERGAAWLASVGERLAHGAILLIDYGFPCREYYHPQRRTGTLISHYRHRSHSDPFWQPGLCDLTAHVDFSLLAQTGQALGLDLLGYTSQANLLLNCGLIESMSASASEDPVSAARQNHAVQVLVSEAEMGELFKAIAFGRGLRDEALGFAHRDRRAALETSDISCS